ncbi:hypothetical protein [Algoriphagus confluentis]|uniref:Uncharacterized protein n=1 Tax=Algoriphagus confluentis TaxID=1697556 RepID=A0ABQ6PKE7_9BACT|nr:hypothetical protein Aconfl_04020 [Algoriphagus confluentis]
MKKNFSELSFEFLLDLNYNLKQEFRVLEKFPKRKKSFILSGIGLFFAALLKSLFNGLIRFPEFDKDGLIVASTSNNSKVLFPIFQSRNDCNYLGNGYHYPIPKFWAYYFGLPYFFYLLRIIPNKGNYEREVYVSFFHLFWLSYGYLIFWRKALDKWKPKFVIVSNDHLLLYRSLLHVCKELDIQTIYVQHAGTSINFPPLTFTYAFLDGQQTYDNYLSHGEKNTSKIYLIGSPRFDKLVNIRQSRRYSSVKCIGVSLNLLDDLEKVQYFLEQLVILKRFQIKVRFHPGFSQIKLKKFYDKLTNMGVQVSFPYKEPLDVYFTKIDFHIAGVSFIHFEAILSGINSVLGRFQDFNDDPYAFSSSGFITDFDLQQFINGEIQYCTSGHQEAILMNYVSNYNELLKGKSTLASYNSIINNINF